MDSDDDGVRDYNESIGDNKWWMDHDEDGMINAVDPDGIKILRIFNVNVILLFYRTMSRYDRVLPFVSRPGPDSDNVRKIIDFPHPGSIRFQDDGLYDGLELGYKPGSESVDTDLSRGYFVPDLEKIKDFLDMGSPFPYLDHCTTDPYNEDTDVRKTRSILRCRGFSASPALRAMDNDTIKDGIDLAKIAIILEYLSQFYYKYVTRSPYIDPRSPRSPEQVTGEDRNRNGRIDGDNGDGIYSNNEVWTETNPNSNDTDSDGFNDSAEIQWGYNPLSKDSDGDGIPDNEEDLNGNGIRDGDETSAINADTDGDGLSDKMELDRWTVLIIYENTYEIIDQYQVYSDPLISDYDEDGINDGGEFENGTDPNKADTDGDGINDKDEIDYEYGSSPTGIDGQPPTFTDFDADYELVTEASGPLWNLKIVVEYQVKIKISAADIFGINWINVHLGGVGDEKIYCGCSTEVTNKEFNFTLDARQAVRSLFNSFEVNITAEDENGNIGFKYERVSSISEILIEKIIGELVKLAIIILPILSKVIQIYIEVINTLLNNLNYTLSISKSVIDTLQENPFISQLFKYLYYISIIISPIIDFLPIIIEEVLKVLESCIYYYLIWNNIDVDKDKVTLNNVISIIYSFDFSDLNHYNNNVIETLCNILNTLKKLIINPINYNNLLNQLQREFEIAEKVLINELEMINDPQKIEELWGDETGVAGLSWNEWWFLLGIFSLLGDLIVLLSNFLVIGLLSLGYAVPSLFEKLPIFIVQMIYMLGSILSLCSFLLDLQSMSYFYAGDFTIIAEFFDVYVDGRSSVPNEELRNSDRRYSIYNAWGATILNIIPNILNSVAFQWFSVLMWSSTLIDFGNIIISYYYMDNWDDYGVD
ncbi:MAG: hypothetical protein QCI82_00875 [Candidatus Thermoplasmatota archaeon]|nr:hypothetical protein [Candidatus Thermoplasmatota archaeon]